MLTFVLEEFLSFISPLLPQKNVYDFHDLFYTFTNSWQEKHIFSPELHLFLPSGYMGGEINY